MWITFFAFIMGAVPVQEGLESSFLVDVRPGLSEGPKVVVVPTPGMTREATLTWELYLEEEGFDVWYLDLKSEIDTEQAWVEGIQRIDTVFQDSDYHVLAHGYGARFVAQANPAARSLVLVGAPLGPQLNPTVASVPSEEVVVDALPWPSALLGPLPMRPYSAKLARAYVDIGRRSAVLDPQAPVVLLASGGDVVAPPECVRLPTQTWTDRLFVRLDGFSFSQKLHGELLTDPGVLRQIRKSLEPYN